MMNENNKKSLPSTLRKTMNLFSKRNILFFAVLILLLAAYSCKNEYPDSIFNTNQKYNPDPVITKVFPSKALAGIDSIWISGNNFSPIPTEDHVFFNGEESQVLSASANQLVVKAPNVSGDSIKIQVNVKGALLFAEWYPYKLDLAVEEYGSFGKFDDAYAIAVDLNENVYVALTGKKIVQITPDRERHDYASLTVDKASGMKVGPNGDIYYLNVLQALFRVPAGGGNDEIFAILPGFAYDLDFDANGNIFCGGGGNAIYLVKLDKSVKTIKDYPDVSIKAVRVYNGYLYVAGSYNGDDPNQPLEGVWRNKILDQEGNLGNTEIVFDFGQHFAGFNIQTLTFSADGDMYLGTNAPEAIIIVHPGNSFEPLYPGVIEAETYYVSWGNDEYLYVNRKNENPEKKKILRIKMLKNGAPYYGRK